MGVAAGSEDEMDDMPISNPLPPPPRPQGKNGRRESAEAAAARAENLSNADFRKMVMDTPRRGEEKPKERPRGRPKRADDGTEAEVDGEKRKDRKFRPKPKEEEHAGEESNVPRYRDRAKERREDVNPDYDSTSAELGSLHALGPPGTVDLRLTDAHRISIENSKFLGAISGVRDFALVRRYAGRQRRVTLESARAKLDRVKATGEKHLKKWKLEKLLNGEVDGGVNLLLSSEFQGQPKVVKWKGFSVEKARAMLEAVKTMKELDKTNVKKHKNVYITSSHRKVSRKASKACSIDEKLLHEGVWVQQAKLKLEAAREKTLKSNRKRKSKALGTKKRNVQRRSSLAVPCMDKEDKGDDINLTNTADDVKVAVASVLAKEPTLKGKRRKDLKQKPVRVSERIANRQLRMQQELMTLKVKEEIGSKKTKLRRNKGNKREESNTEVCTDLCGAREDTGATTSESDTESSAAVSLESTPSPKLTPPAKRRRIQQTLVDTIPPPGTRLSSGVECVPPVSPYGLIQEHLYQDPWKVLVACILLNQTGGRQMHKVIWDLFELCPDAETCISTETEKIARVIHSLGLQNKRAKTLQRFSQDYLGTTWTNVTQLHGIGEYGRDAYAIFCEGRWQDVQPKDLVLNKYWRWLSDTQGLGYGFSQIE